MNLPRRDALFAAVIFISAKSGALSHVGTIHCCMYGVLYIKCAPVLSGPSSRHDIVLSIQLSLNSRWISFRYVHPGVITSPGILSQCNGTVLQRIIKSHKRRGIKDAVTKSIQQNLGFKGKIGKVHHCPTKHSTRGYKHIIGRRNVFHSPISSGKRRTEHTDDCRGAHGPQQI